MKMVDILHKIGETPLVKLNNFNNIFAKLEYLNPSGSLKDRIAHYMIHQAEKRKELKKGMQVIEATSGNTGIAFAMVCAALGYKFTAIMPENVTIERRQIIKAFGGNVLLTKAKDEMLGPVKKLQEFKKKAEKGEIKAWFPSKFENFDNVKAHYYTGKEIIKDMKALKENIDVFVMGIGTGGTIMGVSHVLKKYNKNITIVGIEPYESSVISGKKPGHHDIQGIGEGFIPKIFNKEAVDKIIRVKTKDAIKMTRAIAIKEGLFVGISSGANLYACLKLQQEKEFKDKNIVTVFCDRGERYLSMNIWK
jgi:cysteine synthase A